MKILAAHKVGAPCTAEHWDSTWSTKAADSPGPGNQGSGAPGMGALPGLVRSGLPQGAGCTVFSLWKNNLSCTLMIGVLSYMDITF